RSVPEMDWAKLSRACVRSCSTPSSNMTERAMLTAIKPKVARRFHALANARESSGLSLPSRYFHLFRSSLRSSLSSIFVKTGFPLDQVVDRETLRHKTIEYRPQPFGPEKLH